MNRLVTKLSAAAVLVSVMLLTSGQPSSAQTPVYISVTESITVTDAPQVTPAVSIRVTESITVTDARQVTPAVSISVTESVTVTDAPQVTPAVSISVTESVSVTDSPQVVPQPPPNQPPDQPANLSPPNGATDVSLTPTLTSSAFSDPDAGDTHAASQWQISLSTGDYSSPVFDSGTDASNLTGIAVPSGHLDYSTRYYWHVSHQDSYGEWSDWSGETYFDTVTYNTPTGSPVTVFLPPATVTFDTVTVAGTTSASPSQTNPGGELPSGFQVRSLFVDIDTTASYSGTVTVGISYSGDADEWNLKLYHWTGAAWEDVTVGVDTTNNIAYGELTSLSPFVVGMVGGAPPTCFIATAACGPNDASVDTLRAFRDTHLATNPVGAGFISAYYKLSPPLAGFIHDHPAMKPVVRAALLPAVAASKVAVNIGHTVKAAILSSLTLVSALTFVWFSRRVRQAKA